MIISDSRRSFLFAGTVFLVGLMLYFVSACYGFSYRFRDSRGVDIVINKRPARVVSVVPSITETIFKLGAGNVIKGITYHTTYPAEANEKRIVGGFFSPCVKVIQEINPDVLFVSKFHVQLMRAFAHSNCTVIDLETKSISDSFRNIVILGKLFDKEKEAQEIVRQIKDDFQLIRNKVAKIPLRSRKRVIRLMGRDSVMTPGDDSFQNEMIRAAGGIPPRLGKTGSVVPITKQEWVKFNPQVIYGCGQDRIVAKKILSQPGWRDVDAVREGKIFFFPCDLTCRAATNTGYFVKWLAARLYQDNYATKEDQVLDEAVFRSRDLSLPLSYIKGARILYSHILDFVNKTLVIEFKKPLALVSTLEGHRHGIKVVGNHYSPPPCWAIEHKWGLKRIRRRVYKAIHVDESSSSFLFTGADMDNLAVEYQKYRDMEVCTLVTAGVKSNAVGMSADPGRYYEPGTINIIILPNMELTPRAMTRAIISATEAKIAALMDLDVRSHQSPKINQATGTGTDNMIVVQGSAIPIDNTGGHSKMGELIAKTVYKGVREAIAKQNGIVGNRNVLQRLKERHINIFELISVPPGPKKIRKIDLVGPVEQVLLDPRYSSFLAAAFSLSDSYERGLVQDLTEFETWCRNIAEKITGRKIQQMYDLVSYKDLPTVMKMALNAILNGVYMRGDCVSP